MKETSKRVPRVQVAVCCWLSLLIFGIAPCSAQDAGRTAGESYRSDMLNRMKGGTSLPSGVSQTAFEGMVDRDAYLLGPGDKLILQVWSPTYEELPAVVTGDGRVAVPFAGPVQVAGLSLADAETAIANEFQSALKRGRVSVSLLEPRQFRVHVTGQVKMAGTYVLSATSRVADAIEMAGGFKVVFELIASDSVAVPQAALRQIEIRDARTGSADKVDLLRFYQGGDITGNPYLRDGAVIYVPPKSDGLQTGVFGEVRLPGVYEYSASDNVGSLIMLAGGLTGMADSSNISLQLMDGSSKVISFTASSLATPVSAGDRVFVGGKAKAKTAGSVTLSGQVAKPGGYSIESGVSTVADIVAQAGGILPDAAAQSARLIRQSDERIGTERRRVLSNPQRSSQKDDPTMLADIELSVEFSRWGYGTVVLDLTADEGESGWAGSVVLQDGDKLDIPAQPLGVRVLGYVNQAGEVPWVDGQNLNYYLDQAGGKNNAGWKGRTVILKARNGSQLRYTSKLTVDPGDVLFVPQRPRTTGWERVKDIITVVAQVATIALVIDSASKK